MIIKCFYCDEPATTDDHIVPKSKGGQRLNNLVPACRLCNTTKGDVSQDNFIAFMKFVKDNGYNLKALSRSRRKMIKYRFLKATGIRIPEFQKELINIILPKEERLKALSKLNE